MFKISEVYLKTIKEYEESSDGSQQLVSRKAYLSRDGLINQDYVVAVYRHEFTSSMDLQMLNHFPKSTKFCRLVLDGHSFRSSEVIVVGSFTKLQEMLQ